MAIDQEKLLLEIYGTLQEVKTKLESLDREQRTHARGMEDFEKRLSRIERIVYAGMAVVAIFEPIGIAIVNHLWR